MNKERQTVRLHRLAFARSGDKGDVSNIGVMAKSTAIYQLLRAELTPHRVASHFGEMVKGAVEVYPLDNLESIAIVLRGALGGGATSTLRFDQTGKSMASALLRLELEVDAPLLADAERVDREVGIGRLRQRLAHRRVCPDGS